MTVCAACSALVSLADVDANTRCTVCGDVVCALGRYRLDGLWPGERGHDSVDGIGPLYSGVDLQTSAPVLVRLRLDRHDQRLEREGTIIAGLRHPQVVRLRDRGPGVVVTEAPRGHSLDEALSRGLRADGPSLRAFVESALVPLAALERLSPPVHAVGLHAGVVAIERAVDQGLHVMLCDFSRATDTAADNAADVVDAVRPGSGPPESVGPMTPCQRDLYALGVMSLHLATRTSPAELPRDARGVPDVEVAKNLDPALRGFLQRLLAGRRGFQSKTEALDALRSLGRAVEQKPDNRAPVAVLAAAVGGAVLLIAAALFLFLRTAPAPTVVIVPIVEPVVEPVIKPIVEPVVEPVVEPAVEPVVEPPVKPAVPAPPRVDPPLPLPPAVDDALLRAIEAAVRARQGDITACADDGTDRVKLHLVLERGRGVVRALARGDAPAVRCVTDAVSSSTWPVTPHQSVEADIWVWRRPAFKVAAY